MTRKELSKKVSVAMGITPIKADLMVTTVLGEMKNGLISDGEVILRGFGSFSVKHKNARVGRNPKNGEKYPIVARNIVRFKSSDILKGLVNC